MVSFSSRRWLQGALLALSCLLLPVPAQADRIYQITLHAWPPDASVYTLSSNGEEYQGQVGKPMLVDARTLNHGPTSQFILHRAGFKDQFVIVPSTFFDGGQKEWPETGQIQLVPDHHSPLYWMYFARYDVLPWALAGGALALAGWGFWRRHMADMNLKLSRAARLETLHSMVLENLADRSLEGAVLGTWRLVERVGIGGMATVYRAVSDETLDDGESRAVKVVKKEFSTDTEFRERFRREFEVCASLNHPSVVRIYEAGEHDGYLYLIMEYIKGRTLRDIVQRESPLPISVAMDFLRPVMQAVESAHEKGIVHRDLKPENVMVLDNGKVKVMDFGLAKKLHQTVKVTMTGALLGTPAYMAPEQISGAPLDPSSDQYALGVLAYELFAGRLPFEDENVTSLLFKRLYEDPPRLKSLRPDVPEWIDEAVHRMMEREPRRRFDTLGQALAFLEGGRAAVPAASLQGQAGERG